jgi:hypothetical protein
VAQAFLPVLVFDDRKSTTTQAGMPVPLAAPLEVLLVFFQRLRIEEGNSQNIRLELQ